MESKKGIYDLKKGEQTIKLRFNTQFLYRLETQEKVKVEQLALLEQGIIGMGAMYGILASIIKVGAVLANKKAKYEKWDILEWFDEDITPTEYKRMLEFLMVCITPKDAEKADGDSGNAQPQQETQTGEN